MSIPGYLLSALTRVISPLQENYIQENLNGGRKALHRFDIRQSLGHIYSEPRNLCSLDGSLTNFFQNYSDHGINMSSSIATLKSEYLARNRAQCQPRQGILSSNVNKYTCDDKHLGFAGLHSQSYLRCRCSLKQSYLIKIDDWVRQQVDAFYRMKVFRLNALS